MNNCTEERFLKDVAGHKMAILRDNDVNRHVRFKSEGMGTNWFDVITWPGALCIDGDHGTYVFKRLADMFTFFRAENDGMHTKDGRSLFINDSYWAEKCVSSSTNGRENGIKVYSPERFREAVKEHFDNHFEDHEDHPRKDEVWKAIADEVLPCADDGEYAASIAARDFEQDGFHFQDFFERRLWEYDYHFIWNLYAIAYAVRQYDAAKVTA